MEQKVKLLTYEQEQDLFFKYKDKKDANAQSRVIMAFTPMAKKTASDVFKKTPSRTGFSYEDLLQEAYLGLVIAADKFDPKTGNRFSSYASSWVYGKVTKYVIENWSVVRMGSRLFRELFFKNRADIEKLRQQGEDTSAIEIDGQHIDDDTKKMLGILTGADESLDNTVSHSEGEGVARVDLLADENADTEKTALHNADMSKIRDILNRPEPGLSPDQVLIIEQRYLRETERTMRDLAQELGCSRQTIHKLEKQAFQTIREQLESDRQSRA